ncbi:hypothetical protein FRC12_017125 [Ceratobasidium sp. 428]|nr:hypothetical protein FRC12_017125 [Ceratobasidium sp. 428]
MIPKASASSTNQLVGFSLVGSERTRVEAGSGVKGTQPIDDSTQDQPSTRRLIRFHLEGNLFDEVGRIYSRAQDEIAIASRHITFCWLGQEGPNCDKLSIQR